MLRPCTSLEKVELRAFPTVSRDLLSQVTIACEAGLHSEHQPGAHAKTHFRTYEDVAFTFKIELIDIIELGSIFQRRFYTLQSNVYGGMVQGCTLEEAVLGIIPPSAVLTLDAGPQRPAWCFRVESVHRQSTNS